MLSAERPRVLALRHLLAVSGVPFEEVGRPDPARHVAALIPSGAKMPSIPITSLVLGARSPRGKAVEVPPGTTSGPVRVFGKHFPVAGPLYSPAGRRVDADGFIAVSEDTLYVGLEPSTSALTFLSGRGGPCKGDVPPLDSMTTLLVSLIEACFHSWDYPFVRLWPHPGGVDATAVSPLPRRLKPLPEGRHWLEYSKVGGRGVATSLPSVGDKPCAGTTFPFRPIVGGRALPLWELPSSKLTPASRMWGLVATSVKGGDGVFKMKLRDYMAWWTARLSVSMEPGYDGREVWVDLRSERPVKKLALEISVRRKWRISGVYVEGLEIVRRFGDSRVIAVLGELSGSAEVRAGVSK